jgi:hypothetical protein
LEKEMMSDAANYDDDVVAVAATLIDAVNAVVALYFSLTIIPVTFESKSLLQNYNNHWKL